MPSELSGKMHLRMSECSFRSSSCFSPLRCSPGSHTSYGAHTCSPGAFAHLRSVGSALAGAALICLSEQRRSLHTTKSRPKNSKCILEGAGRGCSVCIQVRLGVNKGHSGFIMGLTKNEPWSFSCHYRQIRDLLQRNQLHMGVCL